MMRPVVGISFLLLSGTAAMAQTVAPAGDLPAVPLATPTQAPAPATDLPAIDMPTMPAAPAAAVPMPPAATETGLPAVPASPVPAAPQAAPTPIALPEVTAEQTYSYGSSPYSVLFTPNQITNMKRALKAYENLSKEMPTAVSDELIDIVEDLPVETTPPVEPTTYPAYQLSSIAYRAANDWTVWLNGTRITPKHNDGEVTVAAVKPDRVWFHWKPAYIGSLAERISKDNFTPSTKVTHRLAGGAPQPYFDRQSGAVHFSLTPNQTFVPGYFRVFEGAMKAPTLPDTKPEPGLTANGELSPDAAAAIDSLLGATPDAGPAAPATGTDKDRVTMEELIQKQGQLVPQPANRQ